MARHHVGLHNFVDALVVFAFKTRVSLSRPSCDFKQVLIVISVRFVPPQVFAPTDAAFLSANLGPNNVADMAPSILENLLLYHTLGGGVERSAIVKDDTLYTALEVDLATEGATLIDSEGNTVDIMQADVVCSNGYLHYVDGVLMPPDVMLSLDAFNEPGGSYEGVFDTFMAGMNAVNLTDDFKGLNGPFTVSNVNFAAFRRCYSFFHCKRK